MLRWKSLAAGALALAVTCASVQAAPLPVKNIAQAPVAAGDVTKVQWRRHGGWGAAPWIGLGTGLVVGSIIASESYRPRHRYYDVEAYDGPYYYPADYHGDPRVICARYFRSFEWNTGLYTTYSGEKRLCPYLH